MEPVKQEAETSHLLPDTEPGADRDREPGTDRGIPVLITARQWDSLANLLQFAGDAFPSGFFWLLP